MTGATATRSSPAASADPVTVLGPGALLGLQRAVGNRALAERLRTDRVAVSLPLQRWTLRSLVSSLPDGFADKDDSGKMAEIRGMVSRGETAVLDRAWSSLGDELGMARAHPEVFSASVRLDDDILDHDCFEQLKKTWRKDVEATALSFLAGNRALVTQEMERTGTTQAGGPDVPDAAQDEAMQDIQRAAPQLERIKLAKQRMRGIKIGERSELANAGMDIWVDVPVFFDPRSRDSAVMRVPGAPSWEEINTQWLRTEAAEAALIRRYPSLAFFAGGEGNVATLKDANNIRGARAEVSKALHTLLERIEKAMPLVGDDLTYTDFPPIHQQLQSGLASPSGTVWSRPVEKAIAKEETADSNAAHLLATLGLGALSAAGFIVASLASGGLATAALLVGVGASASQAGISIDKAFDVAAASRATVDPDMALVTQEQVDAAIISAILDTVFAVIDVGQAAGALIKAGRATASTLAAGRAGAGARAVTRIRNLASEADKAAVVTAAVAEVGPQRARSAAGKSFEELADIVGRDSDLGRRLLSLGTEGGSATTRDLLAKLPTLGSITDVAEAEKVLRAAVDEHGFVGALDRLGGWGRLKTMAAMKGATGQALEAWRAGIVREMQEFVTKESGSMSRAVRTGTEQATSDLDVQIVGGTAQDLTQRAEQWLASRIGQGSPARAKKLLDAEVFVDPTRSHLIDIMKDIDPAVRAQISSTMAGWERRLVFAARVEQARPAGEAAIEAVMREAREVGITELPAFTRLTPVEQAALSQRIDGWMAQLRQTSEPAQRASMAERIGKAQAQINASHADAYVGGGVPVWVTGRGEDVAKLADALNIPVDQLRNVSNLQRVTAAITEGKWIHAAVQRLGVGGPAEDVAKAVKDVGKHGARAAEVLKAAPVGNVGQLDALVNELSSYKALTADRFPAHVSPAHIADLRRSLESTLRSLRAQTSAAIREIDGIARAANIPVAQMEDFQFWLRWELTYGNLTSAALRWVGHTASAIDSRLRSRASYPAGPEPNMSTPVGPAVAPGTP